MTRRVCHLALLVALLTCPVGAQDFDARYRSAVAAVERRDAVTAIQLLRSAAEERPGDRDTQILLGQSHLILGDDRAAKLSFERALQISPDHGEATFLLGYALYQGARYFEAAEMLERAVALSPVHPLPRIYHGTALMRLGHAKRAEVEIRAALRMAPRDPVALAALAELHLSRGRYLEAESSIREVLRSSAGDVEAQLILGRILLESGRPQPAIEVLQRAADDAPASRADVLYLLAQANLRSGNAETGEAILEQFARIRGMEDRVRLLRATLSTNPDDVEAGVELATILHQLRHRQMAQSKLAELRKRFDDDARVRALADLFAD